MSEDKEPRFQWWAYLLAWLSFIAGVASAFVSAVKTQPPQKDEYYK